MPTTPEVTDPSRAESFEQQTSQVFYNESQNDPSMDQAPAEGPINEDAQVMQKERQMQRDQSRAQVMAPELQETQEYHD